MATATRTPRPQSREVMDIRQAADYLGISGGHAVPLRLGGIRAGVQAGQPLAVSQEPAGWMDGR